MFSVVKIMTTTINSDEIVAIEERFQLATYKKMPVVAERDLCHALDPFAVQLIKRGAEALQNRIVS